MTSAERNSEGILFGLAVRLPVDSWARPRPPHFPARRKHTLFAVCTFLRHDMAASDDVGRTHASCSLAKLPSPSV